MGRHNIVSAKNHIRYYHKYHFQNRIVWRPVQYETHAEVCHLQKSSRYSANMATVLPLSVHTPIPPYP